MNSLNTSILFTTIKEKSKLTRDRTINEYNTKFKIFKNNVNKIVDPYDELIKLEAINILLVKNKIKLLNRMIKYSELILWKKQMHTDILNNKISVNEEFIEIFQNLLILNKSHPIDELTTFIKTIFLYSSNIKILLLKKNRVKEEIIKIVKYKIPTMEEINETINKCLKILNKHDKIKRDNEIIDPQTNKEQFINYRSNSHPAKVNYELKNNQYGVFEKINYQEQQGLLHINNIINKLSQIGI